MKYLKVEYLMTVSRKKKVELLDEASLSDFAGETSLEKLVNKTSSFNRKAKPNDRKLLSSVTEILIKPIYGSPTESITIK